MAEPKGKVVTISVFLLALCGLVLLVRLSRQDRTTSSPLLVAAAASLRPPLEALADDYCRYHDVPRPRITYGASGTLAEQIRQGAPYDVFLAADAEHARWAAGRAGFAAPSRTIATGVLVLWSRSRQPAELARRIRLGQSRTLRLAVANPDYAPYGRAARQFLMRHNAWQAEHLVLTANVAQAAQYALADLVDGAFVSLSYALHDRMRQAGSYWIVPPDQYDPLPQTAVVLSDRAAAGEFVRWLGSKAAARVWRRYGYRMAGD